MLGEKATSLTKIDTLMKIERLKIELLGDLKTETISKLLY